MRTFLLSSFLAAAGLSNAASPLLAGRAVCDSDNCARLVTGTRSGLPTTRLADCSSFLRTIVVPTPVTSTRTVTPITAIVTTTFTTTVYTNSTVTALYPTTDSVSVTRPALSGATTSAPANNHINKRFTASTSTTITTIPAATAGTYTITTTSPVTPTTITPTRVPSYATAVCSPYQRYGHACLCAGVSATTVTEPPVTSYTTVTAPGEPSFIFVTTTTTATIGVYATATGSPPVATGLPCGSLITVPFGSYDSFRVRCDMSFYRYNFGVGVRYGVDERQCVYECAQTSNCGLAMWKPLNQVCNLFAGDSQNPGLFNMNGTDAIALEKRGVTSSSSSFGGMAPTAAAAGV